MNHSYVISDESRIQQLMVGSLPVLGGKHDKAPTDRKFLSAKAQVGTPWTSPF